MNPRERSANFLLLLMLGCTLLSACGPAQPDTKTIAEGVVHGIALQSTSDQVLNYLDSKRIRHSQYINDPDKGNSIQVGIPYDSSTLEIVKTSYEIVFHFDRHNRLTGAEVTPHYTGP